LPSIYFTCLSTPRLSLVSVFLSSFIGQLRPEWQSRQSDLRSFRCQTKSRTASFTGAWGRSMSANTEIRGRVAITIAMCFSSGALLAGYYIQLSVIAARRSCGSAGAQIREQGLGAASAAMIGLVFAPSSAASSADTIGRKPVLLMSVALFGRRCALGRRPSSAFSPRPASGPFREPVLDSAALPCEQPSLRVQLAIVGASLLPSPFLAACPPAFRLCRLFATIAGRAIVLATIFIVARNCSRRSFAALVLPSPP